MLNETHFTDAFGVRHPVATFFMHFDIGLFPYWAHLSTSLSTLRYRRDVGVLTIPVAIIVRLACKNFDENISDLDLSSKEKFLFRSDVFDF